MTANELHNAFMQQNKDLFTGLASRLRDFTVGKIAVAKDELVDVIMEEVSGIPSLAEDLAKVKEMSEAFASVFDTDGDGKVTADEILAKIAQITTRITNLDSKVENYKGEVDNRLDGLGGGLDALSQGLQDVSASVSQNNDSIVNLTANLQTNYFTKEDINTILTLNKQEILDEVDDMLADNEDNGDGGDGDGETV